jgi:hypothetical protein
MGGEVIIGLRETGRDDYLVRKIGIVKFLWLFSSGLDSQVLPVQACKLAIATLPESFQTIMSSFD